MININVLTVEEISEHNGFELYWSRTESQWLILGTGETKSDAFKYYVKQKWNYQVAITKYKERLENEDPDGPAGIGGF